MRLRAHTTDAVARGRLTSIAGKLGTTSPQSFARGVGAARGAWALQVEGSLVFPEAKARAAPKKKMRFRAHTTDAVARGRLTSIPAPQKV